MLGALQQRHCVKGSVHASKLVQRLRRRTGVRTLRCVHTWSPFPCLSAKVVREPKPTLLLACTRARLLDSVTSDRDAPPERAASRVRDVRRAQLCLGRDDQNVDRFLEWGRP
jgi:hypothetical protein